MPSGDAAFVLRVSSDKLQDISHFSCSSDAAAADGYLDSPSREERQDC